MKIALFSDLHTEFWPKGWPMDDLLSPANECDVVVLAGDIASGRKNVKAVLKKFAAAYKHVIYLPGNHEYYGSDMVTFNNFGEVPEGVHMLSPGCVKIQDVTFIGAPLWTNFRGGCYTDSILAEMSARDMIADFRLIKGFSPAMARGMFEDHSRYIKRMYECNGGKKVIVTHFLPATQCISERFNDGNLLNYYFANDMGDWIKDLSNTIWMFGHTHDSMDFMLGDTRMVCNPYGYVGTEINPHFVKKVIEL